MNESQRKFLVDRVEKSFRIKREELEKRKPVQPSLNNYLIAAVLDGSIQLNSKEVIKANITEKVLKLGPEDALVGSGRRGSFSYRNDTPKGEVSIQADVLFKVPKMYEEAMAKWWEEHKLWEAEMKQAQAMVDTVILKIQIGSNAALDKLIIQADNLADLSLINNDLKLIALQQ